MVVASGSPSAITFATPKSRTLTCPDSVTITLAGLMSRCTMPGRVRGLERAGDLLRIAEHVGQRQTARTDATVERFAGQELHHDEVDAVVRVDLVDRDDVGMVEGGGGARLLDESLAPVRVGHVPDHLQRDRAIEAAYRPRDRRRPCRRRRSVRRAGSATAGCGPGGRRRRDVRPHGVDGASIAGGPSHRARPAAKQIQPRRDSRWVTFDAPPRRLHNPRILRDSAR